MVKWVTLVSAVLGSGDQHTMPAHAHFRTQLPDANWLLLGYRKNAATGSPAILGWAGSAIMSAGIGNMIKALCECMFCQSAGSSASAVQGDGVIISKPWGRKSGRSNSGSYRRTATR